MAFSLPNFSLSNAGKEVGGAVSGVLGGMLNPLNSLLGTTQTVTKSTPVAAADNKTWTKTLAIVAVITVVVIGIALFSNKSNS